MMNKELRTLLINIAKNNISSKDPSHDIMHAVRVLKNSELIAKYEKNADLDIITPASLYHDKFVYPKNNPRREYSQKESAKWTKNTLIDILEFPQYKIPSVEVCIIECSFSNNVDPRMLESRIVQDADKLEATGVISIMRTFSSTGQMGRPFYNPKDPFCSCREPDSLLYALDLFYTRLLKVPERMHTEKGREIAERRTKILYKFLDELKLEIDGK
jgi:uncharacterized protein